MNRDVLNIGHLDNIKTLDDLKENHKLVYAPDPVLDKKVDEFPENSNDLRSMVATHMIDIMQEYKGVGLAANQINLNASVFVMLLYDEPTVMFNPQILEVSNETVLLTEGCLSEPGLYLNVKRPSSVMVQWEDAAGDIQQDTLFKYSARIFLHEFDHLCGVLFTDRVGKLKLQMARKKQKKIVKSLLQY